MRTLKPAFHNNTNYFKLFIICLLLSLMFQGHVAAACTKPEAPEMPNIETAVVAEMVKAQKAVKRYMKEGNQYLDCTRNNLQHDAMVSRMEKTATKFNILIRDFKALKKK